MARNILVINCDIYETRVALIEEGVIAELQIERAANRGTVGNVVLGKVTRVLPGMQAAFIDVGLERAAFLHVEDLIRPHDFEAYLTGQARDSFDEEPSGKGVGGRARQGDVSPKPRALLEDENGDDDDDDDDDDSGESAAVTEAAAGDDEPENEHASVAEVDDLDDEEDPDEGAEDRELVTEDDDAPINDEDSRDDDSTDEDDVDDERADVDDDDESDDDEEEEEEEEEEEDAADAEDDGGAEDNGAEGEDGSRASQDPSGGGAELAAGGDSAVARRSEDRSGRRRRKRRRRSRGNGVETNGPRNDQRHVEPAARGHRPGRDARKDSSQRDGRHGSSSRDGRHGSGSRDARSQRLRSSPLRVSRSVPITEVVKEGDEVIVQISKEPIGTKGARVTSHVSLPGRYVVYLPTVEHIGISKRIGSARERTRLRAVMETMKPERGGLIVRTVAEGLTKKSLKHDIGYLVRLWAELSTKRANAKAPAVLYTELDLVLKTARDLFTDEIQKIVIDDREQYARLVRFVEMFMPERVKDIELYGGDEPIFDAYGIEDEIGRALSRKVPLESGGYLIIDQAEALTAIDVNTGRYVGKGSKDLEETALKTNLEAVEEIAYQLRFRNIGGLVILDLIDMESANNRDKVWRALEQRLAKDKAKTTLNRISELGLIEMTRKRTRESLSRTLHEPCFYCDGTGQIMSRTTIAYEILRQIRRERQNLPGYSVLVNAHPAVVDFLTGDARGAVSEAERRYMRRIEFNARREYHIEQFDLQGK